MIYLSAINLIIFFQASVEKLVSLLQELGFTVHPKESQAFYRVGLSNFLGFVINSKFDEPSSNHQTNSFTYWEIH